MPVNRCCCFACAECMTSLLDCVVRLRQHQPQAYCSRASTSGRASGRCDISRATRSLFVLLPPCFLLPPCLCYPSTVSTPARPCTVMVSRDGTVNARLCGALRCFLDTVERGTKRLPLLWKPDSPNCENALRCSLPCGLAIAQLLVSI